MSFQTFKQVAHECMAGLELRDFDIFVGLVRLCDIARAADHRAIPGFLELSGLGPVGDLVAGVVAGDLAHEGFGQPVFFGL